MRTARPYTCSQQQLQCAGTLKCAQCAVHVLSGQHDARSSEPDAAVK